MSVDRVFIDWGRPGWPRPWTTCSSGSARREPRSGQRGAGAARRPRGRRLLEILVAEAEEALLAAVPAQDRDGGRPARVALRGEAAFCRQPGAAPGLGRGPARCDPRHLQAIVPAAPPRRRPAGLAGAGRDAGATAPGVGGRSARFRRRGPARFANRGLSARRPAGGPWPRSKSSTSVRSTVWVCGTCKPRGWWRSATASAAPRRR